MNIDSEIYLAELKKQLIQKKNWQQIVFDKDWKLQFPSHAGVYVFKENNDIVYVGETGNLRGRMKDLFDTRHHTVRRTIGQKLFSSIEGYHPATSKVKFAPHIEIMVNNHICTNLSIAFLEIKLGRKELEEMIEKEINPEIRLNKRGKRKTE